MYDFLSTITWPMPASGENYTYSNLAFALLGESLPAATSSPQSYTALLEANVLRRLGMMSTVMFNQVPRGQLPRGYGPDGQPAGPGSATFPAYSGAGGAVSTPTDVMAWLQFNMGIKGNPVLTPLLPALQRPSTTVLTTHGSQLGLGWFLTGVPTLDGPTLNTVWKNGGYAGYRSYVTFLASDQPGTIPSDAGVFVLTNSAANVEEIARAVLCLMCGHLPVPPASRST
jgi:CubicO group peptidase (beta-lactamase class C family)